MKKKKKKIKKKKEKKLKSTIFNSDKSTGQSIFDPACMNEMC